MADRYTSLIGLELDAPVADVGALVHAAIEAGDLDRAAPVRDEGTVAQEVNWGGRMQKAVVRHFSDVDPLLLRTETYVGADGIVQGLQRQAGLLEVLARRLDVGVLAVRDVSAMATWDTAWMHRVAIGVVEHADAIATRVEGEGTWWVRTHGAARFDVPDLELYGLHRDQVEPATALLAHVHTQLLDRGLRGQLALRDGTPIHLVPVLEAWEDLPLDWPGIGRAGRDRGEGLDGPRATVSILHRPRFGRYRKDFDGVLAALAGS
ncbi:MAG: hypothetical protein WDZ26_01045 [Nitriliruptoraceae bacterium]